MVYYERLCVDIAETAGNEKELTATLVEYRDLELYNKHINAQHCEIATGDIFKIGSSYYILVSQSCDTCLRSDGCRSLDTASLLEIQDGEKSCFSYKLSCFLEMKNPVVMFKKSKNIPFDILDLCVLNDRGQASIVINSLDAFDSALKDCTINYRRRFEIVLATITEVFNSRVKLDSFWNGEPNVAFDDAKKAHLFLDSIDKDLKGFEKTEIAVSFPVHRIARLNELQAVDIARKYGEVLSRIGHPFDFSGNAK